MLDYRLIHPGAKYLHTFYTLHLIGVMESHSVDLDHPPGRNPGTSTKVMSGMLKQSQNLTNLAALTEALMSRQPDRHGETGYRYDNDRH